MLMIGHTRAVQQQQTTLTFSVCTYILYVHILVNLCPICICGPTYRHVTSPVTNSFTMSPEQTEAADGHIGPSYISFIFLK